MGFCALSIAAPTAILVLATSANSAPYGVGTVVELGHSAVHGADRVYRSYIGGEAVSRQASSSSGESKKHAYQYGSGGTTQDPSKAKFFFGKYPRKCTASGDRCAGAANMPYVEYAPCCAESMSCVKDSSFTWGYVCVEVPDSEKTCTADGAKCHGVKADEYVPFSSCCGGGSCVDDKGMGSGKYCKGGSAYSYYDGEMAKDNAGDKFRHGGSKHADEKAKPEAISAEKKEENNIHPYLSLHVY